jgi:tryptophan synthase alpha chain
LIKFGKKSLVAYVTVGDPDLAASEQIILGAIDAGAAVIELGVPFSDPLADGPVIQRASERALKGNVTLEQVIALGGSVHRQRPEAGLIIFTYLNPVVQFGVERFAEALESAGIDGALLLDLTIEEADEYRRMMQKHGRATVFLAAPTSPDERLKRIAKASSGFIYAVARTGVTGAGDQFGARAALRGETEKLVKRIKHFTKLPVAVGFGISDAQQFADVMKFADAGVVGTAIVKLIESDPANAAANVSDWIKSLLGTRSGAKAAR